MIDLKIRTDDSFDLIWNLVTKKAEDKAVEEPKLPRQRRMPARFEMGTAEAVSSLGESLLSPDLFSVY